MTEQERNEIDLYYIPIDGDRKIELLKICAAEIRRLQESDKRKDEIIAKLKEIVKREYCKLKYNLRGYHIGVEGAHEYAEKCWQSSELEKEKARAERWKKEALRMAYELNADEGMSCGIPESYIEQLDRGEI